MPAKKTHYKQFITETGADNIVADIEAAMITRYGKRPVYSDLVKVENGRTYEYVNYVQEGGGMLGVGLVGYTYVMEKLGFRFLKLAGTSAGAINTMMLAAVDKENYKHEKFEYQSEIILQEMLDFNLWNLVDGHWFAKWLIKVFINQPFGKTLFKWLLIFALSVPVLYAIYATIIPLIIDSDTLYNQALIAFSNIFKSIALIAVLLLILVSILFVYFRYKFARSSYGINPGRSFHAWMKDILKRNKVENTCDLEDVMKKRSENLTLRDERIAQNIPGDNNIIAAPYLTIVASDITTQTKVEFPLMAKDYWADTNTVSPADFVRASMAIPIFFEPFKVTVEQSVQDHSRLQQLKAAAADRANTDSKVVSFVDGGILSNFPINVFHNPNIKVARMPTFGVKLEDEVHIEPGKENKEKPSLLRFIGNVFSTIRFYYDRDFLKRNEIYEKSIAHVDVAGFNWLNFGMGYDEQKKLFIQGALAAKTFFLGGDIWVDGVKKEFTAYNWEDFKYMREKVVAEIKASTPAKEA
jgi:NTE family protein